MSARLAILGILVLSISLCLGADNPNVCKLDNGQEIPVGETASHDGKCEMITCEGPGSISGKTCAEFVPAPGCTKTKIDFSKPYPECCPHSICPEEKD